MEAVATATERENARQAEIKKLQNETCFIGHPFGVGIVSFKYMMGSVTSYGFSAIFIYYLYAAAPQGLGLTQLEASQFITLDIALGSIFGVIGSYMADRVFGNRRAYRFCAITAPMYYFSFAIPNVGMLGLILYCVVGYVNSAIAGSSLYSLLGKLYAQGDKRRDGAFSVIYVLSNIGSMCPVVIGGIALVAGYQVTFFILGVIGALGSIVYLILEKRAFGPLGMEPDDPLPPAQRKKAVALLIAFFIAFGGILFLLFDFKLLTITSFANIVSVFTLILPVIYFVYILRSKKNPEKQKDERYGEKASALSDSHVHLECVRHDGLVSGDHDTFDLCGDQRESGVLRTSRGPEYLHDPAGNLRNRNRHALRGYLE